MKLGEAMVKEGLITNDALARALERQIIFGGRLGTNLVEMGSVSEETLARFLSKILHVTYAEPALFENIEQEVLDALPAKTAEKYTAFPIKKERSRLHLAMKDPNDIGLVDELRFVVGLDIKPYIASEMRILYALEKYYGIKRDLRYISLLDEEREKAARQSAAAGPMPPPISEDGPAYAPAPAPREEEYLGDESQTEVPPVLEYPYPPPYHGQEVPVSAPAPAPVAMRPAVVEEKPPAVPDRPQPVTERPTATPEKPAPAPEKPAYRNPYEMLASPVDREHVAHAIVQAAARELKRAVLFMVKGGVLMGWKAAGDGLTDETVSLLKVTLDGPTIFKETVEDKVFYKGPILKVPQNTSMLAALGEAFPQEAIVYPIIIKGKVVGVLYGDNGHGALITGGVERLASLAAKASMSLEILIMKNKILSDT